MRATSGKASLLLANVLRAFPFSVALGLISGAVLHRLASPRLFCYSALAFPLISALSWGYFLLVDVTPTSTSMPPSRVGQLFWAYFCIYGWYFFALFISNATIVRIRARKVA